MSEAEMEVAFSDSEAESTGTRSPTPTHVSIELYQQQVEKVDQLKGEQALLVQTIQELKRELQKLRQSLAPQAALRATPKAPPQDRPKRKKEPTSSDDEEAQKQASQPKKKTPEAPTRTAERDPQQPGPSRDAAPRTQEASTPPEEAPKVPKIPPVMVRNKERWTQVSQMLRTKGIQYTKARLTNEGIAVTAATVTDFRRMTAAFNDTREEYHTYTLAEDRLLRVVIRGIPGGVSCQEIAEDLREQGFIPKRVDRMTSRRTRQQMPLVLIQVPQDQQRILEVKRCCSLVVRVERQRVQQQATQCHRCQRFGHGQSRCTATPKCVKCGQEHETTTCTKAREEPAKCANCGGDHPASYRGCPKYPKLKTAKRTPAATKKPAEERPQAKSQPPRKPQAPGPATTMSYAQAAAGKSNNKQQPKASGGSRPESMECVIAQFQQQIQQHMLEAFKTFMSKIPSLFQV